MNKAIPNIQQIWLSVNIRFEQISLPRSAGMLAMVLIANRSRVSGHYFSRVFVSLVVKLLNPGQPRSARSQVKLPMSMFG